MLSPSFHLMSQMSVIVPANRCHTRQKYKSGHQNWDSTIQRSARNWEAKGFWETSVKNPKRSCLTKSRNIDSKMGLHGWNFHGLSPFPHFGDGSKPANLPYFEGIWIWGNKNPLTNYLKYLGEFGVLSHNHLICWFHPYIHIPTYT